MIDERIVRMSFDNDRFERNAKTTMSTLDKLKEKTQFKGSAAGIEELSKAVSDTSAYDKLSVAVDNLNNRFSVLGIAGMRVISNLTDSLMNLAGKAIGFITNGVISGGIRRATNLENAHFQLQGLLKDETAVQKVMEDVNYAVDGTAYGLDEAALVASQLTASGIEAGDSMKHALHGISGVAAMANTSYAEVGDIFATIAGNGKLMTEQLRQFSFRGLNVAATLATVLGKTEAEVRDMVSKGQIDFQTFADAMDSAFGEHADKANETFNGAMSNVRAALARIGALFVSPLIEQNGPLVQLLNNLRIQINNLKTAIVPFAEMTTSKLNGALSNMAKVVESSDTPLKILQRQISNLSDYIFPALESGLKAVKSILIPVLEGIYGLDSNHFGSSIMSEFNSAVIQGIAKAFKFLADAFTLTAEQGESLRKFVTSIGYVLSQLGGIVRRTIIDPFLESTKVLSGIASFKDLLASMFDGWSTSLTNLGDKLRDINLRLIANKDSTKNLVTFLEPLLNAFTRLKDRIFDALESMHAFDGLCNLIGKGIEALTGGLQKTANFIGNIVSTIGKAIGNLFANSDIKLALNGSIFIALLTGLKRVMIQVNKFAGLIRGGTIKDGVLGNISLAFDKVRSALSSWEKSLDAQYFKSMALAIVAMSAALLVLSSIEPSKIEAPMKAMTAMMASLIASIRLMSGTKGRALAISTELIALSTSLIILSIAMKLISTLSWEEIAKGLVAIGASLQILALAVKRISSDIKRTKKIGNQFIKLASAILVLSLAMKIISKMEWEDIAKGLVTVGVSLQVLAKYMKSMQGVDTSGIGKIFVLSSALLVMSAAMKVISGISVGGLTKAVSAIAALMYIMNQALAYSGGNDDLKAAGAMVVMAAAIAIMVPALAALGILPFETIVKGLLALGAAFGIIGLAGALIGPMATDILLLAAGIAAIGVGIGAASAGLAMFLTVVAASPAAIGLLVDALKFVIEAFIGFIPDIVKAVAAGLVELVKTIAGSAADIAKYIFEALSDILSTLVEYIPKFAEKAMELLHTFTEATIAMLPQITEDAVMIIVTFISSLADSIEAHRQEFTDAIMKLINSAIDLVISILTGSVSTVFSKGKQLFQGIIRGVKSVYMQLPQSIRTSLTTAIQTIKNFISNFFNAGVNVISGFVRGIRSGLGQIAQAARDLGNRLLGGIKGVLGIHSPSKEGEKLGMYSDQGLANGVLKFASIVSGAGEKVGSSLLGSISGSLKDISDTVNSEVDISPAITPVVSTKSIESAVDSINSMLNIQQAQAAINKMLSEQELIMHHTFDVLTVKGVNDNNELVATADYAVEEFIAQSLKRQYRV